MSLPRGEEAGMAAAPLLAIASFSLTSAPHQPAISKTAQEMRVFVSPLCSEALPENAY